MSASLKQLIGFQYDKSDMVDSLPNLTAMYALFQWVIQYIPFNGYNNMNLSANARSDATIRSPDSVKASLSSGKCRPISWASDLKSYSGKSSSLISQLTPLCSLERISLLQSGCEESVSTNLYRQISAL